ncbi:MAG: formate dehydrogenase accessory sulfurtransferase FdhD [Bacillota bacterium]
MGEKGSKEIEIRRVKDGRRMDEKDHVAVESPLTIFFNEQELVTLLCSPRDLQYLALGFLRSEGLINGVDELEKVTLDQERSIVYVYAKEQGNLAEKLYGKRTITSGCGKGTVFFHALDSLQSKPVISALKVKGESLFTLMRALQERSLLFHATGGVHSAALAEEGQILVYSEDIGRHNAMDKIVGECLVRGISLHDRILLSSGRLSVEIVLKGAKMGLPLIVSRSAPTSLAVELADRMGITLVGFVRGSRFNIYTHEERIL